MIVVDTGAMVALLDATDEHHAPVRESFDEDPSGWILPWAILPEVDYLIGKYLGVKAQEAFLNDLAEGAFTVEWGRDEDLTAAKRICTRYRSLGLGLVDAAVIA